MDPATAVDTLAHQLARARLSHQEGGLLRGRRVLLVPITISPVYVKYPQVDMDGVLASFQTTFALRLNKIFHCLYQQSAPAGNVKATHEVWLGQVTQVAKEITGECAKAAVACTYILVTGVPNERSKALLTMMSVETLARQLMKTCDGLCLLLKNEAYTEALEYFKAKTQECAAVATKKTVEKRVKALFALLTDMEQNSQETRNIEPAVAEEVRHIYKQAVQYSTYTGRFFSLEVSAIPTYREIFFATMQRLDSGVLLEDPPAALEPWVADISRLPYENYFLNGQWSAKSSYLEWATRSYGKYSELAGYINDLHRVSAGLYDIECSLQERMKQACQDENGPEVYLEGLDADLTSCYELERRVLQQRQSLQVKIPSEVVHAGWMYAGGLFAQVRTVRETIAQFRGMIEGDFGIQVKAFHKVIALLEQDERLREPPTRLKKLLRLYDAVCAVDVAEMHVDNTNKAFIMLKSVLAKEGSGILEFTPEEKGYAVMKDAEWGWARETFQTYLMAGCLKYLYFGGNNREFKEVYFRLKGSGGTSSGFRECLEASKEFKALCEAFEEEQNNETAK